MTSARGDHVRAVVVTWNPGIDRLTASLEALLGQTDGVVIVDNDSSNREHVRDLAAKFDRVDFIGLQENEGIGSALNVGVERALGSTPEWILTMDQDTLLHDRAIGEILESYELLDEGTRESVGVLAMRSPPQSSSPWIVRYSDRLMTVRDLGKFIERRGVITSGNLVRADIARRTRYNEELFIDQVDFDFCFAVRREGNRVLQMKKNSMDHLLGEMSIGARTSHPFENAQRMYYISRNSTYLVLRRRMALRFYLVQNLIFCGAYVSKHGATSIGRCLLVVARGCSDGIRGILGRREYRFLEERRS